MKTGTIIVIVLGVAVVAGGVIWLTTRNNNQDGQQPGAQPNGGNNPPQTNPQSSVNKPQTPAYAPITTNSNLPLNGALPQTVSDANIVMLSPNATDAQYNAANTIILQANGTIQSYQ